MKEAISEAAPTETKRAPGVRQNVSYIPAVHNAADLVREARMDYSFGEILRDRNDIPTGSGEAIVSALTRAHPQITRMVRYATRMNGLAARPGDVTATMVIGKGMAPACQDEKLMRLYNRWAKRCGAEGLGDMRFVQELAWREYFNVGECFVYMRRRRQSGGQDLPVGLQLQVMPTEMVPTELPFLTGDNIRAGQVLSNLRETTAYYVYKHHPGDRSNLVAASAKEVVRVSSRLILHVMRQREAGALRGESALARSLVDIHDFKKYLNAEMVRKILSANIAYWVELPDLTEEEKERLADVFFDPSSGKYVDSDGNEVEPPKKNTVEAPKEGSVASLPPGAKINMTAPAESGNSFSPFLRQIALQLSASLNIPVEYLLLDMAGVQDRIYKGISQQFERQVEMWRADFAAMFLNPVWNAFVKLAVEEGKWTPPEGTTLEDWLDVDWVGQPFPNLHRAQEVSSWQEEVEAGFCTRSDIIRRQGDDPERVRKERLADLVSDIRAGLSEPPMHWTDEDVAENVGWDQAKIDAWRKRSRPTVSATR
ncbi:lambda family phage portal protein [Roseovarius halotolerans]|uniref:Phage portal protein, lambda family n=1 Tax=Roseovarius halotolerans TaxID=505353 RepID=A0A1X6Y4Z9_9RHOB|nr:phage portal protein [Roseovarius halotolerans]RKT35297.1 lambda family phage portal protein [Roseovarius halotolerans]SLN11140.1 Phage portal protein, lambda family [Roseovarius halotolerans]